MDIKITVLMSVYNTKEEYLREAIESILSQTMREFEFIIINDASNDQTINILDQYTDDRILRIDNEVNLGLTVSLNKGLSVARGKYIARMDSDDISYPNRLELQYNYMQSHPDVAILGGWTKSNGKISKYQGHASSKWRKTRMLIENVGIAHPTAFMRTGFLKKHNLVYDESIKKSQDYDLWTRCLEHGDIAICPHVVLEYRIHDEQISIRNTDEQVMAKKQIRTRLLENIEPDYSNEELEQFLTLENINMEPIKFSNFLDKLMKANEKKEYYDNRILKWEFTFVWLKIILGIYKSVDSKKYLKTHWFYRMFNPVFWFYLVGNTIVRNV